MIQAVSAGLGYSLNEINKANKGETFSTNQARNDKLNAIAKQIENGEYKIDLPRLARTIADELI